MEYKLMYTPLTLRIENSKIKVIGGKEWTLLALTRHLIVFEICSLMQPPSLRRIYYFGYNIYFLMYYLVGWAYNYSK